MEAQNYFLICFIYLCYTNWEGHQRLHLSRASPVFPQVIVVRKSLNLTTNWPVRALVSPGKVFRTIAKLPERWSDIETQALGETPGIEPGTSRMLSERSTFTPLPLKFKNSTEKKSNFSTGPLPQSCFRLSLSPSPTSPSSSLLLHPICLK